jgi:hypothetical protein
MFDPERNCEVLTLANCMPRIREVANETEWIAGITPTRMGLRLAYLMRVDERLPRRQYWDCYRRTRLDSIYKLVRGHWHRFPNPWHNNKDTRRKDLSSKWVLWSRTFYVFANSYDRKNTAPLGLELDPTYAVLQRGGMRAY